MSYDHLKLATEAALKRVTEARLHLHVIDATRNAALEHLKRSEIEWHDLRHQELVALLKTLKTTSDADLVELLTRGTDV